MDNFRVTFPSSLISLKVEQYREINGLYSIPEDEPPTPPPAPPTEPQNQTSVEGESISPENEASSNKSTAVTVIQVSPPASHLAAESAVQDEGGVPPEHGKENTRLEPEVIKDSKSSSKESSPMSSSLDSVSSTATSTKEPSPDDTEQANQPEATPPIPPSDNENMEKMEVDSAETVGADTVGTETVGADTVGTETVGADTVGTDTRNSLPVKEEKTSSESMKGTESNKGAEPSSVIVYTPPIKKEDKNTKEARADRKKNKDMRFMFNIADGGFTELHNLWSEEKIKGFSLKIWGRHHDYWLLKGLVTYP